MCSVCEILGLTSSSTRKSSIAMIYDDIFLSTECCNSALLELRRKHSIPQNDKPLPIKSTVGTAHQWRSEKENGCTSKQPRVHLLNFCNQSATIVIRLCFYPKFQDDICSKILCDSEYSLGSSKTSNSGNFESYYM